MLELHLIRHGQSVYNVQGRWQGHGDAPLSDLGRAQAAALGRALGGTFDHVYASDLQRAAETAAGLAGSVTLDPQWRELDVGGWEGKTAAEVAQAYPGQMQRLAHDPTLPVGGGESWNDLRSRALGALAVLRNTHPEGRVAVVAHGGIILTLCEALLGLTWRWPRWLGRVRNTARAVLVFESPDDPGALLRYNVVDHLQPPPGPPAPIGPSAEGGWVQRLMDPPRVADHLGHPEVIERLVPCAHDQVGHLFLSDLGATLLTWGVVPVD